MKLKKLLALFLVVCILVTSVFATSAYAADDAYDLEDVNTTAQYLAGWDVGVDENTLDYNCDGKVNLKDLVLLAQFVAGWNVVIGNGSNSIIPDDAYDNSISVSVTPVDNKVPAGGVVISNGSISAIVPEGVLLIPGTTTLTLKITYLNTTEGGITAGENEELVPVDVHIEGVSKNNTVPIVINLGKVLPEGLNLGNYRFFHVEDGVARKMTLVDSVDELTVHNTFTYNANTGEVSVAMATFSSVIAVYDTVNPWQGEEDYSWYDVEKTELTITNADQLYAFAKIVGGMAKDIEQDSFGVKTVKLLSDINLNHSTVVENGISKIFYPVGYYNSEGPDHYDDKTNIGITSGFYTFEGTFDGNGHTISNVYQNTWEMKGDHDWYSAEEQNYRDGMGIFGKVYGGTVKNLTVDNFESDGEITTTGVIAAYADGATFENIAITNCNPRVYNIGNGGIVGCVGWYAKEANLKTTFKNITVDNSNKISALWGSYDVACGGIVGQYYPTSGQTSAGTPQNAGIHFENCHATAKMDVYNDVCANYQYYAYRYTGMLIGSVRENETIDGHLYPKMDGITASGCTVHFGDWNDYYYCELVANSLASYTHDHQFSRLEQVKSVNVESMTYTNLKGVETAIPTSGRYNYVVVTAKDDGTWEHADDNATCYHFVDGAVWNHANAGTETVDGNEGVLKEDKQHIYLEFNNLVTGYGWGVTSKGVGDMEGVTILDREPYSVEKFAVKDNVITAYKEGMTVSVGKLFKELDNISVPVKSANVQVFVSPVGEGSTASATYTANTTNWEDGTIIFSGTGLANITISDYYFCKSTTFTVNVTALSETDAYLNDYKNWQMIWANAEKEIPGYDSDGDGTNITNIGNIHNNSSEVMTIKADNTYGRTDNSSVLLSGWYHYSYIMLPDIKANKEYTLTFYYSGENKKNSCLISTMNLFTPTVSGGSIGFATDGSLFAAGTNYAYTTTDGLYANKKDLASSYQTTNAGVEAGFDNWNKVEITFNSGNFTTLALVFLLNGSDSDATLSKRWIDDISLVECNQNNSADMWNGVNDTLYITDANGTALTSWANISYEDSAPVNYPGSTGYIHISSCASQYITTKLSNLIPDTDYTLKFSYLSPLSPKYDANANKYFHIGSVGVVKSYADYKTINTSNTNLISVIQHYTGFENHNNSSNRTAVEAEQYNCWIDQEIKFNSEDNTELVFVLHCGSKSPDAPSDSAAAYKDIYLTNFKVEEIS